MSGTLRKLLPRNPDSLLHDLAPPGDGAIGSEPLAEAYRRGDPLTRGVVNHAADLLGVAIANWVTVLSLQTVLVGGGITEALGEPYLDRIRRRFARHVFPDRLGDCQLLMTTLKADSALLGAALLARQALDGH